MTNRTYEDGLHPVLTPSKQEHTYSDLPQVYEPNERAAQPAPQAYLAEKSAESAPVPVDAEDGRPPEYDNKNGAYVESGKVGSAPEARKILGITRRSAIIIGIVALLAILALAIGLGVGLSQSRNHNNTEQLSSSSTAGPNGSNVSSSSGIQPTGTQTRSLSGSATATSSTATAVATSGFTGISDVQCPRVNNTIATSGSSRFRVLCAVHWITGQAAANNNGTVQAVGDNKLVAYSLQECLDHCVRYNNQLNRTVTPDQNGSGCLAVTYNANLTNAFAGFQQNCFLKDRIGVYDPAADTTESAVLVNS